ncbi:MAG: biopolymer transporter ExbD [Deltaproteobacteria bacterium]|nr:biopolymer transporter ExbD [Deltaproteobacteria bacterium]
MSRLGKKKVFEAGQSVELNIMPFIDVFSLLCTFLLFSAVFLSVGIHFVQIPFISNAAPSKEEVERQLNVSVDVGKDNIELVTSWSEQPLEKKVLQFPHAEAGIAQLHKSLIDLKQAHPKVDKVDLFLDDEITYDQIIGLLDQIKLRFPEDPRTSDLEGDVLFPKVVFGSVML